MAKRKAAGITVHEVGTVKLGALVSDGGNPRRINEAERLALEQSLTEFGLVQPFVARAEDKRVIGGHQRAAALLAVLVAGGLSEDEARKQQVPVVLVPDLSESRCRALNLALNKIGGEWDYDKLSDYLAGLEEVDIPFTGFSTEEFASLIEFATPDLGGVGLGTQEAPLDVDAYLEGMKLTFTLTVANAEDAAFCRKVLEKYGMSGPQNAGKAFVAALTVADSSGP